MAKKALILICAWSTLLVVWVFANPPNGPVGLTLGTIATDALKNIGIGTNIPASTLDVNGTTTIRKSLDMTNNQIINVTTPTSSADAANKAYVDMQVAAMTTTTPQIWSEGRPGTAVITVAGVCGGTSECYKDVDGSLSCNAGDIKIARSTRPATWDKARAACPAGWWICSSANRDINFGAADYGTCGSGNRTYVLCDMTQSPSPTFADDFATDPLGNTNVAWISNAGATTNEARGRGILIGGTLTEAPICSMYPVWCCTYQ